MFRSLLLIAGVALTCMVSLRAQPGFELNLGGSNLLGATFNATFEIGISRDRAHKLIPYVGGGTNLIHGAGGLMIFQAGMRYEYRNWGIGVEVSASSCNYLLWEGCGRAIDVPLVVFPFLSYTWPINQSLYLRGALGVLLAYDRNGDGGRLIWQGDPIPGASLTVGWRFRK